MRIGRTHPGGSLFGWRGLLLVLAALLLGAGIGWALNGLILANGPDPAPARSIPPTRTAQDGHLTFLVQSFACGLTAVQGTHAEGQPSGQFCQLRVRVDNHDPDFHDYVSASQRLAGVPSGDKPDSFAMAVRRQPDNVHIGGHNAIEVELWYDIPLKSRPVGLAVSGDSDPSGFRGDGPSLHKPGGVLITMTPEDRTPR